MNVRISDSVDNVLPDSFEVQDALYRFSFAYNLSHIPEM